MVSNIRMNPSRLPGKFGDRSPPAKTSALYKIGTATVAVAMVLLPLLYLALIAGVAYATWRHGVSGLHMFEGRGSTKGKLLVYVTPLVVGALVVVFMIKPLFARRPKSAEPLEITREQEPALFAFIEKICDLVSAPRPRRVLIDLQVNASASFRRGFLSFLGQDLTLTIGLPLVAGLTVRQFGGVLAHEFGHFAQGAGMRLTYIIRTINAWFSRIVYERDAWDEYLTDTARTIDLRIGVILHLSRLMIWLTRKLLWVFMMAGHGISCFMLRQMEFDADYYETQVSGSGGFASTAERLRLLGIGWQRAISQQQESYQGKRLVNDLPGLIAIETHRLPADLTEAVQAASREATTGWFDTHPSDLDRVRASERHSAAGVLVGESSASSLFADFSASAQKATEVYYRQECELELNDVRLLPLGEMAAEAAAQADAERSLRQYFGELLSIRTLIFLDVPPSAAPATAPEPMAQTDVAQFHALLEQVPAKMKALLEA
jgi:Zn-dependent protease with chaperone function